MALAAILIAGSAGEGSVAQEPSEVTLEGTVIQAGTAEPVPQATVLVVDSYGDRLARQVTDETGGFSAKIRRRTAARLEVGKLGYESVVTPLLHFGEDELLVVEVMLDVDAVPLAPLEVVATAESSERAPLFEGFDHRRDRGFGSFFTRPEIEDIQPQRVTDLLQRIPGVQLVGAGAGHRRTITMHRSRGIAAGRGCPVQIFLDGVLMTRVPSVDVAIDDLVAPGDLEGVEIYRGLATVPAEFLNPNARCGVVALWTRRGDAR